MFGDGEKEFEAFFGQSYFEEGMTIGDLADDGPFPDPVRSVINSAYYNRPKFGMGRNFGGSNDKESTSRSEFIERVERETEKKEKLRQLAEMPDEILEQVKAKKVADLYREGKALWKTQYDGLINVTDMKDDHLENTVKFLKRKPNLNLVLKAWIWVFEQEIENRNFIIY